MVSKSVPATEERPLVWGGEEKKGSGGESKDKWGGICGGGG